MVAGEESAASLGAAEIDLYRDMLLIRRFEEKAGQLYGMGLVAGFCHLGIGQEAVVVGTAAVARDGDQRIGSHRAHGHALVSGMAPEAILSELLGRADGACGGKGGSLHVFGPERGFWGGHGILGAQVPIGAGIALAQKTRGTRAITFVHLGDVAADQGQVAETFALAASLKLPVLFVIENNSRPPGAGAPAAAPAVAERARAHGLPVAAVDGMDVLAVRETAERAALHVRAGKGAMVIEARTYRYRGHALADPGQDLRRAEDARTRATRDPIAALRDRLLDAHAATEDDLREIDREVRARVAEAADAARAAPEPDARALLADVVAEA